MRENNRKVDTTQTKEKENIRWNPMKSEVKDEQTGTEKILVRLNTNQKQMLTWLLIIKGNRIIIKEKKKRMKLGWEKLS